MSKRVVVIASGETERRAIPYLLRNLLDEGTQVSVRIPPRNGALSVDMAFKLIRAAQFHTDEGPPDKFVVLVDVDGKIPSVVLDEIRKVIPRLPDLNSKIQFAYAKWHLEAWYFADANSLRAFLQGDSLGNVDTSQPDDIQNPKHHLRQILVDRVYTAQVSEDIAKTLDGGVIAERSPSFQGFVEAAKNGWSH